MLRSRSARVAGVCVAVLLLGCGAVAVADPGEDHGHDGIAVPEPTLPLTPPGSSSFTLLGAVDKDATTNSDIAFYGDNAYVGNYDGFRIIDVSKPDRMHVLSDTTCRANQGDVSVFKARDGRLILLQSIDRPVAAPDCTGVDTAVQPELEGPDGQYTTDPTNAETRSRARFGYEGLRMFDVTDAKNPRFLRFFRTACGSHTHTLAPDLEFPRFRGHLTAEPSARSGRMCPDAQDTAVFEGVQV